MNKYFYTKLEADKWAAEMRSKGYTCYVQPQASVTDGTTEWHVYASKV